jgi:triosephosphate isomerase
MKYVIANWKMNPPSLGEAVILAEAIKDGLKDFDFKKLSVGVCPSFVHLPRIKEIFADTKVLIGAQNSYFLPEGAFTGEVSLEQLQELVSLVIVGHSERRANFGETDEIVNRKIRALLALTQIKPILCVGENLDVRNKNKHVIFVVDQITKALDGVLSAEMDRIIIAYEPVWAIGTGIVATSDQAREMISEIRQVLDRLYKPGMGAKTPVLYGGSTNGDNVEDLVDNSGCDGFLVGGASLKPEQFIKICQLTAGE